MVLDLHCNLCTQLRFSFFTAQFRFVLQSNTLFQFKVLVPKLESILPWIESVFMMCYVCFEIFLAFFFFLFLCFGIIFSLWSDKSMILIIARSDKRCLQTIDFLKMLLMMLMIMMMIMSMMITSNGLSD